jgi:hypothetical protein
MLDRVKAGACRQGMRQQELVGAPGIVGYYMTHADLDLLYFKATYANGNFI